MTPRVVHVISTPEGIGGAERVMLALLRGGAERGWQQAVLNPFERDPARSDLRIEAERIEGVAYLSTSALRIWRVPDARRWIRSNLHRSAPQIVHVHLFHALVLMSTLRMDSPVILSHQHGNHLKASGRSLASFLDRVAGRRMDHVVACSEWVRKFLLQAYGYPSELVSTVHNGWEGKPKERPRGNHQPPILVCVANFREQKGHRTLIESFELLAARHPKVRLRLIGDGPLRAEVASHVASKQLGDRVEFVGAVPDVWSYLATSDVFVLASNYEPLGIAVLEAMAAGLPVVASDVGGIPEIVANERSGILVPPGEPAAFAFAIDRLLGSDEERERMGLEGRRLAERWRIGAMVERYFELYERILDERCV